MSLRRAVAGRSKSFDGLLKEHKAVKDANLKAKAEAQRVATATSSVAPIHKGLAAPVTTSSALNMVKQQAPVTSFQSDGNFPHAACSSVATRTTMSSSSISTTATTFVKPYHASNLFHRYVVVIVVYETVPEHIAIDLKSNVYIY